VLARKGFGCFGRCLSEAFGLGLKVSEAFGLGLKVSEAFGLGLKVSVLVACAA
jgi:hypothetical protein